MLKRLAKILAEADDLTRRSGCRVLSAEDRRARIAARTIDTVDCGGAGGVYESEMFAHWHVGRYLPRAPKGLWH